MRTRLVKRLTALAAVAAAGLLIVPASAAMAEDNAEQPPSLVEDFSYPGAAAIADIELLRGDGKITRAECTGDTSMIVVESIARQNFCFRVTGAGGWLTLRLDRVFIVQAGAQTVEATITSNGEEETVVVPEGELRPTGTTDPNFAVLLELRATN